MKPSASPIAIGLLFIDQITSSRLMCLRSNTIRRGIRNDDLFYYA